MFLRIITGIIGITIAAFVIQYGGIPFAAFAVLLTLVAWHEYADAFSKIGIAVTYIFGAVTLIFILLCAWLGSIEELLAVITLGTLAIFLLTVLLYGSTRPTDACVSVAGVLYIGLPFAHLILLRFFSGETRPFEELTNLNADLNSVIPEFLNFDFSQLLSSFNNLNFDVGCSLVWVLFLCTWASDTFAYFVGSAIGAHKLASSISPKKTVEGFLGGVVGTTLTAVLFGTFVFGFPLVKMAIAGVLLAVVATLGDLVESVIKRYVGIKDSGFLIPGHGGVLDRFDSILYTAPVFYHYVMAAEII